jgi:hypothetical protein
LAFADLKELIELTPKVFELNEVKVASKKKNKELKVGIYKGLKMNAFFASSIKYPNLYARYFPFKKEYKETPFLKQIMPYCKSDIKDAKFRVRLFEGTKNGEPGKEILQNDLIITVRKGNSKPVINIENYNIIFPENGFFVGLEYMYLESNIHNYKINSTINGVLYKNKPKTSLEPSFGVIKGESEKSETWRLSKEKWFKRNLSPKGIPFGPDGKDLLAIELTLTN